MLKMKVELNEKSNKYEVSVKRIGFKLPFFLKEGESEEAKKLASDVFGYADAQLALTLKVQDSDSEEEKKVKEAKEKAIKKYVYKLDSTDRLAHFIAVGLKWYSPNAVQKEFLKVYELATEYARKYKECIVWDDSRKTEFTAIRTASEEALKAITGQDVKISSKNMNAFLDSLYTVQVVNKKDVRACKFSMMRIEKAFQSFAIVMCHQMGIAFDEAKVVIIKTF